MQLFLSLCALSALSLVSLAEESLSFTCRQSTAYDDKHTFVLASLEKEDLSDRRAESLYKQTANACYQNCNAAELMSLSSNYWKHRAPVTLLDRAATFLIESDFLLHNETYFVNHMAGTEEGPSGLECLVIESPSEFSLYPVDDPACASTKAAVCGLSGMVFDTSVNNTMGTSKNNDTSSTVNPDHDVNNTSINISSGLGFADALDSVTSTDGKYGGNSNGTATQIIPDDLVEEKQAPIEKELEENLEPLKNEENKVHQEVQADQGAKVDQEVQVDQDVQVDEEAKVEQEAIPDDTQATGATENDLVYPLTIGNLKYKVIRLQQNHKTTESASTMCQAHRDKIGSLYSLSIPDFSSWFQRVHPIGKSIIGTWNGDSYGARDTQCLTYSVSNGVHLGPCADASVLLCESNL